ncbi:MAG: NUDIX hydrolase [Chloroflexi bacterium]|nr:NUDIX hydrolase [Chloroflexota bacterium]
MEYWEEMRALVGARPLLFVGCAALIFDDAGRVLLIRRADSGQWAGVGGLMDLGETVEETVRREVREEVGLEITDLRLLGVVSGPDAYYRFPNGDESHTVGIVHTARVSGGSLALQPTEVLEARWFSLDDLPENLTIRTVRCLQMYRGEANVPGCLSCRG